MALSFRQIRNFGLLALLTITISFNLFAYHIMQRTAGKIEQDIAVEQGNLLKWSSFIEAIRDSKDYLYYYQAGQKEVISPVILLVDNATNQLQDIAELERDSESRVIETSLIDELSLKLKKYRQTVSVYVAEAQEAQSEVMQYTEVEETALNEAERIVEVSQAIVNDINYHIQDASTELVDMNRNSQRVLLLGLILFAALTFGITSIMGKALSTPMTNLINMAQSISSGNYKERISLRTDDEMGQLACAFNNMAEVINDRTDNLTMTNKKLKQEVAERRRTENELENLNRKLQHTVQRLAKSNRELQEFNKVASHDMREPLRRVTAFGKLLLDTVRNKLTEDEQENMDLMIEGAVQMQMIIDNLLAYSNLTEHVVRLSNVDLNKVVANILKIDLAGEIEKVSAKISVPEKLASVTCDRALIHQLLHNLIINGIRFRRDSTMAKILIRSRCQDEQTIRIEVKDNGIGIKGEYFSDIFKMFRRLNSRQNFKGAGMGLALCKKIVELHNGTIGIESTWGEGSTFWFTLPLCPTKEVDIGLVQSGQAKA